jgi:hypothetical protein
MRRAGTQTLVVNAVILAIMACGGTHPMADRARVHDAGPPRPTADAADPEPKTTGEPEPVHPPEAEPEPEVWHRGPGVDVVAWDNSTVNTHGVGRPWLSRATVGLNVRDRAHHTIEVEHLTLVVNECGPLVRDGHGIHEVVRKRHPLAIRDVRLLEAMGDHVLASGTRIALPARVASYELDLRFDTTELGETCGDIAFAVELMIDHDHAEVALPIGIPHDIPRRRPVP